MSGGGGSRDPLLSRKLTAANVGLTGRERRQAGRLAGRQAGWLLSASFFGGSASAFYIKELFNQKCPSHLCLS